MPTRNLNQQDIYKAIKEVSADLLEEVAQHQIVSVSFKSKTELWFYTEDDYGFNFQEHNLLKWLQSDYLNDWGFVKSIDYLEFYYDKSGNPAATIKYTIEWIDEDNTEVVVNKLNIKDDGWAVLIFYGEELTLAKKNLYYHEAQSICTELSADLSDWNITELIRSEGFEKYA